jgi:lipopolysaccharide transport system permease protein
LITALIDFLIALLFLAGLMAWYGWIPTINVLFLPAFAILASAVSLGLGIWVAALMVEYRDLRLVLPFLVQFGLYLSPVGFVSTVVPEHYRFLYSINPMVGVIDGFRWCVLGNDHLLHISSLAFSIFGALFCLVTGIWYFRRTERTFADVI